MQDATAADSEMFILDSLMISGIQWALETTIAAAEAEMNDDSALREQLLEAEMRREMGEISDEEFAEFEADVLARIREIKERREGGRGPLAFGEGEALGASEDEAFHVEASVSGDFYDPATAPHTAVIEHEPPSQSLLVGREAGEEIHVLDMEPGDIDPAQGAGLPLSAPSGSRRRAQRVRKTRSKKVQPRRARPAARRAVKAARASRPTRAK
jgi:hypothetical protein